MQKRETSQVIFHRECAKMSTENKAKPLPASPSSHKGSREFLVFPGHQTAITGGTSLLPTLTRAPAPSLTGLHLVAFLWLCDEVAAVSIGASSPGQTHVPL